MTNEELKKKIVDILNKIFTERDVIPVHTAPDGKKTALPDELCEIFNNIVVQAVIPYFADALIAAGIGDLKEHRIFAGKDGSIKQLYSGEEVEKIVKERKELKDELRSKVEYIHEQDEVIKEYKHRAEVAERALENEIKNRINITGDVENLVYAYYGRAIYQAEKELAEEGNK